MTRSAFRAALVAAALLLARPADAGLNLPQFRRVVTLAPGTAQFLRTQIQSSSGAGDLPLSTQTALLKALPEDFTRACGEMIENWGEIARGTAEWRARILYFQPGFAWLGFRCRSRAPEYEKDYDERPALLRLAAGKLELYPLSSGAENDSLYHLEFAEALPLEGAEAVSFKVSEPDRNPCCDGPESRSGERLMLFVETPQGVRELLSLLTARDDSSHSDDPEIDSETIYRADVQFERDAAKRVIAITASFHEETKDTTWEGEKSHTQTASQKSGTLRHRWNAASLSFEAIK